MSKTTQQTLACEPYAETPMARQAAMIPHAPSTRGMDEQYATSNQKLRPLLKWPGGKDKEIRHILPAAPDFEDYYEPFVGGGSVFAAFQARRYFINDKSQELIRLYQYIALSDQTFFAWADAINQSWQHMLALASKQETLADLYLRLNHGILNEASLTQELQARIHLEHGAIMGCLPSSFRWRREEVTTILCDTLRRKMLRMRKVEGERGTMPLTDIMDNIVATHMGTLYTYFRSLYNDRAALACPPLATALFLFLRHYAYSGMFRYNDDGEFNVPYGGLSYNRKTLSNALDYYRSPALRQRMRHTTVRCMDFEAFLGMHQPSARDFVFLDPPYDSEFSTYAQNSFTLNDHDRLARYLLHECKARWMLVIKATPHILNLYQGRGLSIKTFEKTYQVSFMNRNNKSATHLMVTNY